MVQAGSDVHKDSFKGLSFTEEDLPTEQQLKSKLAEYQRDKNLGITPDMDEGQKAVMRDEFALEQAGYQVYTDSVEISFGRPSTDQSQPRYALQDSHVSRGKSLVFYPQRIKENCIWYFKNRGQYALIVEHQKNKRSETVLQGGQLVLEDGDQLLIGDTLFTCKLHQAYIVIGVKGSYGRRV